MALSDTKLRGILGKPYKGKPELPDRDGVSVRITPFGTITWQYRYRWHGKPVRLTLGRYPDISIKDVRNLLPEIRGMLHKDIDPRESWRKDKSDADLVTCADCVDKYLSIRVSKLKPKSQTLYQSVLMLHYCPLFKGRQIDMVKHQEWLDWLDGIGTKNPKLAGSLLKVGKTMFRWCMRRKMIGHIPLLDILTADVGKPSDVGHRVLSIKECQAIWRSVDLSRAAPNTSLAIKFCILFACRQSEIVNARREHFNMDDMIWTVPKELSKTNKPIRRPITEKALALIKQSWMFYGEAGYLLPSQLKNNKPISASAVNRHLGRIADKLLADGVAIEPWRCHDFRRTLSTRLSEMEVMPHVTEKMLGHALTGVMAVYNKHDWIEQQRDAYTLWGNTIVPE